MIHITEKTVILDGAVPRLIDFDLDAYANLEIEVALTRPAELEIAIGEVRTPDGRVNREPGGFRIVRTMRRSCPAGNFRFAFELPRHQSPYRHTISVPTPAEAGGEVVPFRYVEITGGQGRAALRRHELFGEFDDSAAHFECSDARLNRIWEFCKYTMKATGAFGIYIDGERERKPYEGDAFINQLGCFCCGGDFETARKTIEHFLAAPTYPTEWQLLTPLLARDYLLYSGDTDRVQKWLPVLKERTLFRETGPDFLLRDGQTTGSPRTSGSGRRDLVDWPVGERDGYEFGEVNLVPNCYFYGALQTLAELTGDGAYRARAAVVKRSIDAEMAENGRFFDNPGSRHTALHSAFFPLYFNLADDPEPLKRIIPGRGMACSVYGAQFLVETCFRYGMSEHAFALLRSDAPRSWFNMLRQGATISMEAWDDSLKPNQDWNHAWGAAPANLLPRWVAGIRPTAPGFDEFVVEPQPGDLEWLYCRQFTRHGAVELEWRAGRLHLTVPRGTVGHVGNVACGPGRHTVAWSRTGFPELCLPSPEAK